MTLLKDYVKDVSEAKETSNPLQNLAMLINYGLIPRRI